MKKTALITGATGDIGREIALTLANAGYDLVLCGNRSEFDLKPLKCNVQTMRFDVSNAGEVKKAFDSLKKQLDLVVSCAGIAEKETLLIDKRDEEIERIVAVDLLGTIYVNKYALAHLKKGASIVNISSFLGVQGCSCEATYSAAKGGIITLTKSLAKEYAPFKVRVNCVSPGYIDTKMNAEFSPADKAKLVEQTPVGRLGTAQDVAKAVLMLSENDFITGENLVVSGGLIL